jgi:hypothetical protein
MLVFRAREITLILLKRGFKKVDEQNSITESISICKIKQLVGELIAKYILRSPAK